MSELSNTSVDEHPMPAEYGVEILRAEVGSTLHGISIGNDDIDQMGVCIEHPRYVVGLEPFEQYIYRTAAARESRQDAPSKPGDLDLCVYSLRKWCRLALKGNPSVLLLLFVPRNKLEVYRTWGGALQSHYQMFLSRQAGKAFLGYLEAQKSRLLRERGTARIPDRGDKDAKYLAHMLRLGYQGRQFMTEGWISLPMRDDERQRCLDARSGTMGIQAALTEIGRLERDLKDLATTSPLPEQPNQHAVEDFLLAAYEAMWARTYGKPYSATPSQETDPE